ncbi:MAG: PA14 domain-containing protein [Polyangiales bacterium]
MKSITRPSHRAILFLVFVAASAPSLVLAHEPDSVGGGYARSGMLGKYFANPDFEGPPAFTRRDVRISFDWGTDLPVGGSPAEPYHSFPRDGFSIRWNGAIIPRFSEPYRFIGHADDSIRIRVRTAPDAPWTTVVDQRGHSSTFESAPVELIAGRSYELEVEYVERDGAAACELEWVSPSTPREIVDPVSQQGLNAATFGGFAWANLMKSARFGEQWEDVDELGWPTKASGTELVVAEMGADDPELEGTYLLRFEGEAKVRHSCCGEFSFVSNGARLGEILPKGTGYDAATNSTSALMIQTGSRTMMYFDDARRSRGGPPGVTDIRLMRPISPGSTRTHAADEIVYRPLKQMLQDDFTAIRWLEGANKKTENEWKDRALPHQARFSTKAGQENWEYLVILANETGKDLFITTPVAADDEYFEKLARLIRFGSDGREPYAKPTSNPVYPPLNPNLRIYIEVGNEIWNWSFDSTELAEIVTVGEAKANSATWAAIDFDGEAGDPQEIRAVRRWLAYRTVIASRAFRRVLGDAAMGPRVRVMLEYQYDNFQVTAEASLWFIDAYFGGGHYDGRMEPVTYDLWAAGGATYYAFQNKLGTQEHTVLRDPSFETPAIPPGTLKVNPDGSPWRFRGNAGLVSVTEPGRVGDLEKVAKPVDGKQAAFLRRGGTISQQVDFTRPGKYAIAFSIAGTGEDWPGHMQFEMYVDDERIDPRGQTDVRRAEGWWSLAGWWRQIDDLKEDWGSAVFDITTPGPRTIRFVGGDGDDHILIDNIRIASLDAILESGFDAGEAAGQVGDANLARQFRSQAKYARTFGLQVIAYEAGWSLGGDFYQTPIQTWAKYKDARARAVNDRVIELWDQSGSFMNIWGVYQYWPDYAMEQAALFPLMQSLRGASERLRAEPTYGAVLPASLRVEDADWSSASSAVDGRSWWRKYIPWLGGRSDREWYSWMLISPTSQSYSVRVRAQGEGTVRVEIDGDVVSTTSKIVPPLDAVVVPLTKGAHAVRVVATGDVDIRGVEFTN